MASAVAMMIGGAIRNAAAFTGGNYLERYLSGDNGQAALDERSGMTKPLNNIKQLMKNGKRIAQNFLTGLQNKIVKKIKL